LHLRCKLRLWRLKRVEKANEIFWIPAGDKVVDIKSSSRWVRLCSCKSIFWRTSTSRFVKDVSLRIKHKLEMLLKLWIPINNCCRIYRQMIWLFLLAEILIWSEEMQERLYMQEDRISSLALVISLRWRFKEIICLLENFLRNISRSEMILSSTLISLKNQFIWLPVGSETSRA